MPDSQLERVLEGSSDGFFDWHVPSGRVQFSPRYAEMLGYRVDELSPTLDGWRQLVHPEDVEQILTLLHDYWSGRSPSFEGEQRMRTRTGEWKWVLARGKVSSWMAPGKPEWMAGTHVDIDRRKHAELALKLSQQRFDLLVRQSPLAVIEWSLDARVTAWNPAAQQIFGYPPEQALGMSWTELVAPNQVDERGVAWAVLINDRTSRHSVLANIARGGATVTCEWFSTPLIEECGRVVGVASICRDCTEEHQAYAELRKLWQALEQSPMGVLMTDVEGRIEYVNARYVEMSGYTAEEALGNKPSLVKSGFHPRQFYHEMWRTILSGAAFQSEICNRRKNGEIYWEKAVIAPVRDPHGALTSFIAIQDEITDRKLMERQLAATEERFKGIIEAMHDGCLTVDSRGQITLVNPAAVRLLGYRDEADLTGVRARDLFADQAERQSLMTLLRDPGQMAYHRASILRKDGSVRLFEGSVRLQPVVDGTPACAQAVFRDVTERVQADAERLARQAADEASRLKSEFLAHMSHEIRTPLNAILGMAHLALETTLTDRQRHYLDQIQLGGRSLLAIVNDILDFSKIEAGRLELERLDFALDTVLENVLAVLGRPAEAKGLELDFVTAPDVPAQLRGDPARLGQVLINLVSNAIKFTQTGHVVVKVEAASLGAEQTDLLFTVRDTGVGLTPRQIESLFVSFAQADSSITRRYGGTGLGLVICQRLIGLMGGEIRVESQPGQGSCFTFTASFQVPACFDNQRLPDLTGVRVVLPEAEEGPARDTLQMHLRRLGVTVATGLEDPCQLAFITHLDSLALLRDLPQLPTVWVVAKADQSLPAGIHAVLLKPYTMTHLLLTLLSLLDHPELTRWHQHCMPSRPPAPSREGMAGARVLLVEDNLINQEIARELLLSAGLEVDVASNGREALEQLLSVAECPWQAILMDLQMPVMDGYTATAAIRANPRFRGLPILAMTAHVLPEERERCYAAGMDDYITKPIDPEALFATLQRWLTGVEPPAPSEVDGFPVIPGVDTRGGLRRVAGQAPLYGELLREFALGQAQFARELLAALARADRAGALARLHALRGTAGNLGLIRVHNQVADLESELRAGGDAHVAAAGMLAELEAICAGVLATLPVLEPAPVVEPLAPQAAYERLESLLENNDGKARTFYAEFQAAVGPRSDLEPLARLIRQYDLEGALHHLRSLGRP